MKLKNNYRQRNLIFFIVLKGLNFQLNILLQRGEISPILRSRNWLKLILILNISIYASHVIRVFINIPEIKEPGPRL